MNLVIVSQQCQRYADLIESRLADGIVISQVCDSPSQVKDWDNIHILLGEPHLCAPLIGQCRNLKWLQSTWAGVRPIVETGATNLLVSGVKDLFGKQMREFVFAYLLHFARHIDDFRDRQKRHLWQPLDSQSLYGKTIGIAGVGSIGASVAETAKGFDLQVYGLTNGSQDCPFVDRYFKPDQICDFARSLDFLILLLPDTPATYQLVDHEVIQALPSHCILINAGRANAIDHRALIDALSTGSLAAAVLDVLENEPLESDSPLWDHPKVWLTQHTSAKSHTEEIVELFVANLTRFAKGRPIMHQVDMQKGY